MATLYWKSVNGDYYAEVDEQSPLPVQMTGAYDPLSGVAYTEEHYQYAHIAANSGTNVVIKAGPGFLHAITWNLKGVSSSVTTIADNATNTTTGNVISVVDSPNLVAGSTAIYDIELKNGLAIQTLTAVGPDMTISFR